VLQIYTVSKQIASELQRSVSKQSANSPKFAGQKPTCFGGKARRNVGGGRATEGIKEIFLELTLKKRLFYIGYQKKLLPLQSRKSVQPILLSGTLGKHYV
jgi:hypothetical protein